MTIVPLDRTITYEERLEALKAAKLAQTREKVEVTGYKDHDDHALILPHGEGGAWSQWTLQDEQRKDWLGSLISGKTSPDKNSLYAVLRIERAE